MDLVEIDVVGAEAAQGLVEFEEDLLAREAAAIGAVAHDAVELGGDHRVFALCVGLEEAAEHALAVAGGIDIGGVEEVDAEVESLAKEGLALLLVEAPCIAARAQCAGRRNAVRHAAETDARDLEASAAKIDVVHSSSDCEALFPMLQVLMPAITRAMPTADYASIAPE